MTKKKQRKPRKLSHEILGLLGVAFVISIFLFQLLNSISYIILDKIAQLYQEEIATEQLIHLDIVTYNVSLIGTVIFFILLFLFLLRDRLIYIRDITKGIHSLQNGQFEHKVPEEGNNELTQLAKSINYLSESQKELKEKEQKLKEEKEQFIRTMSHDIRTPLTSILAYSELMLEQTNTNKETVTQKQTTEYMELIHKKALQIKDMTDILLDGGKRNVVFYENGHLLMEQLLLDFESLLEDTFSLETDLSKCADFKGSFDIGELQRIFDNLASNIQKYADSQRNVSLKIWTDGSNLWIQQKNAKNTAETPAESFQMGLNSIRRIAHNYNGRVDIKQDEHTFEITIILSDIS